MAVIQQTSLKCLACGSTELGFGNLATPANVFIPTGMFTVYGFKSRAYVCLKCGTIGHYLPKDTVEKLKDKLSSSLK